MIDIKELDYEKLFKIYVQSNDKEKITFLLDKLLLIISHEEQIIYSDYSFLNGIIIDNALLNKYKGNSTLLSILLYNNVEPQKDIKTLFLENATLNDLYYFVDTKITMTEFLNIVYKKYMDINSLRYLFLTEQFKVDNYEMFTLKIIEMLKSDNLEDEEKLHLNGFLLEYLKITNYDKELIKYLTINISYNYLIIETLFTYLIKNDKFLSLLKDRVDIYGLYNLFKKEFNNYYLEEFFECLTKYRDGIYNNIKECEIADIALAIDVFDIKKSYYLTLSDNEPVQNPLSSIINSWIKNDRKEELGIYFKYFFDGANDYLNTGKFLDEKYINEKSKKNIRVLNLIKKNRESGNFRVPNL